MWIDKRSGFLLEMLTHFFRATGKIIPGKDDDDNPEDDSALANPACQKQAFPVCVLWMQRSQ